MGHEQLITLRYVDNVIRKVIAEVDISQFESRAAATEHLLKLLQADGFTCATDKNRLYVLGSDTTFEKCDHVPDHAVVFYSATVVPNSAAEYDRKNGISYFFHSSEGPHSSGHIYMLNIPVKKSAFILMIFTLMENSKMQKKKKKLLNMSKNICDLLDEWNRIHDSFPIYAKD